MHKTALAAWPLFTALFVIMLGSGLQSTLLGVRAETEHFDPAVTGLIMGLYYGGYIIGAFLIPKILERIGYTHTMLGIAATATLMVLLHGLVINELVWALLRAISGICFVGLFIIVESWLNGLSTNETRGRLMSLYLILTYAGVSLGNLMINLWPPATLLPFLLCAALIFLSPVGMLFGKNNVPAKPPRGRMNLLVLFRTSFVGMTGNALSGIVTGAVFGTASVYAMKEGFSVKEVSFFMTALVAGGAVFPFVIGWFSDKFDRHLVLCAFACLAAVSAIICHYAAAPGIGFYALSFIFGGLFLSLYAVCAAIVNDSVDPSQYVGTSAAMLITNSIGALLGPVIAGFLIRNHGPEPFFPFIALTLLIIALMAGAGKIGRVSSGSSSGRV